MQLPSALMRRNAYLYTKFKILHSKKKNHPVEKVTMHERSKHRERYDFKLLLSNCPELAPFVHLNKYKDESVDFFNPKAVKMLNKALLKTYYGIDYWDIPEGYLCPPIPGRADYLHHIADLIGSSPLAPSSKKEEKPTLKVLDIGVGANCVYPIIGVQEYGWNFVGSDIDPTAIRAAQKIVDNNEALFEKVELRLQKNKTSIFKGIIQENEQFDLTICNPPFHASQADAQAGTLRKLSNLKRKKVTQSVLNFGGQNNELWCEGGEEKFVRDMIVESKEFAASCRWFSTLISKHSNLDNAYKELKNVGALEVKTLPMSQGNKMTRVLAWRF